MFFYRWCCSWKPPRWPHMKIGSIVFISMISEYLVYCKCGAERVEMNQFYRLSLFIPSFIVGNFRTVYNAWREINEQKSAWFVRVCLCLDQVYKWLLKISLGFRRSHKFIPKKTVHYLFSLIEPFRNSIFIVMHVACVLCNSYSILLLKFHLSLFRTRIHWMRDKQNISGWITIII